MAQDRVLNVNVGVLGHVDSGKTSLGTWKPRRHVQAPMALYGGP
jgi:translation elongation factor EF-Tu-like GTPase